MEQTDEVRARLEEAAAELERGAAHCRRAAEHFRGGDVPRGTAHAWAARGHLLAGSRTLDEQAEVHRTRANV